MIISKQKFVEIMDLLKEARDIQDQINDIFSNAHNNIIHDFCNAGSLSISHEYIVINLLSVMFNNENDISYFVYELDYGKNYKPGMITEANGDIVDLSCADKLYDYLVSNLNEEG